MSAYKLKWNSGQPQSNDEKKKNVMNNSHLNWKPSPNWTHVDAAPRRVKTSESELNFKHFFRSIRLAHSIIYRILLIKFYPLNSARKRSKQKNEIIWKKNVKTVNELQRIELHTFFFWEGIGLHDQQKRKLKLNESKPWYLWKNHVDSLHYLLRSFSHLKNSSSVESHASRTTRVRVNDSDSSQLCIFFNYYFQWLR